MLTYTDIKNIYSFFSFMKEKGYSCYLENSNDFAFNGKSELIIMFEFNYDEYEYIEKIVKDWILFHSDLVSTYILEVAENGVDCRFNLYVRERFL